MTRTMIIGVVLAATGALVAAEETKPVPKDSIRVSIQGCAKGAAFTAGPRSTDVPVPVDVAEGSHFHMNGPKKVMTEIKAHETKMIEITGIVKRDDLVPNQMSLGKGVGISAGPPTAGGTPTGVPRPSQAQIDVEGWRQVTGDCPRK
jgi:hypothetical protein